MSELSSDKVVKPRFRISCINKEDRDDPYESITFVGGFHDSKRWRHPQKDAIENLKNKICTYFVEGNNGEEIEVILGISPAGNPCIKTKADDIKTDNLLSLEECPVEKKIGWL